MRSIHPGSIIRRAALALVLAAAALAAGAPPASPQIVTGGGGAIGQGGGTAVTGTGVPAPGLKSIELVRKPADESVNNSTVLQNDDHLLTAIAANEIMAFDCTIFFNATTAADFKFTFAGPAGIVGEWGIAFKSLPAGTFDDPPGVGFGTTISTRGVGAHLTLRPSGLARNAGTAGNLTFQWAQNTAEVGDTTVQNDSFCMFYRL